MRLARSRCHEENDAPWMAKLHRCMGLHEVRDNAVLSAFLSIGRKPGNPRDLPWCGDAVERAVAKVLPLEPTTPSTVICI
jgi:hypothetical protein